jgi:hypothetical protein
MKHDIRIHHLPTIHVTTMLIVICAALCAERVLVAYPAWKLGRRKGRMWLPYVVFGLLGLLVLAVRSPAYSVLTSRAHARRPSVYTNSGFGVPVPTEDDLRVFKKRRRKRPAPLGDYHIPEQAVTDRAR